MDLKKIPLLLRSNELKVKRDKLSLSEAYYHNCAIVVNYFLSRGGWWLV